jgi:RNA polymerase sigma factor (sigma-70 family)
MSAQAAEPANDHEEQDARDARLLRRVATARAASDPLARVRENTAIGDLLAPYWPEIRRIVGWRLASISPQPADIDEVASRVMANMAETLKEKTDFGGAPFRVVVFKTAVWRSIEFWRAHKVRREHEPDFKGAPLDAVISDKRPLVHEDAALVHAEVIAEIIEDLGPRDQRILVERYVAGFTPQEIADRLGVAREVVDTAHSRALARLRQDPRIAAVRNRLRETA